MNDEAIIARETHIAILRKKISYEEEVRRDRRWQFEQWDKNSGDLIEQYRKELELVEGEKK